MATYAFWANTNGNIIPASKTQLTSQPPDGYTLFTWDTMGTPSADDVWANANLYTYSNSEVTGPQPYWTFTQSTANGTIAVTATLKNPPATPPTQVVFFICGQTFTETLTNGTASITVDLHPSVVEQTITIAASATGCVSGSLNIGGSRSDITLQAYTPSGATSPTVAPTGAGSKSFLSDYWTSTAVNAAYSSADVGTWIGMLLQTVYGIILPALSSGTSPIVTLDADQANALSDIAANVLPNLLTTLENAAPKPATGAAQTYDLHYEHASHTFAATKQAILNYVHDLQTIPNLA